MVTFEQLRKQNARRPFAPFWVMLTDGETIHVTEPNKAVVTQTDFVFTPDRRRLRHIPLDRIASQGALSAAGGSNSTGDER